MYLIVGLGNPGEKYQKNRHNVGFMVLDKLASSVQRLENKWEMANSLKSQILKINYTLYAKRYQFLLIKPLTFMNNAGMAVNLVVSYYKVLPENIIVIHDDIDLPLGKLRLRMGGASAGHHGVDSIMTHLGSDKFIRIRLGVGRGKLDIHKSSDHNLHRRSVEKFVLSDFPHTELSSVRKMVEKAQEGVLSIISQGLKKAMNKYN